MTVEHEYEPEFVQTARELVALFDDPEPGLFVWSGAVSDLVTLLHDQIREWMIP